MGQSLGVCLKPSLTLLPIAFRYDNATADITDNHYYMYKEDIARIAALGVK